jgi:hypothetical protein
MTESTTATAVATPLSIASDELGRHLVATVVNELRTIPDHWMRLNEQQQQTALNRIKDRLRETVVAAVRTLAHGEVPGIACTIDGITIKEGTKIGLVMDDGDPNRHALYDSKGKKVMLLLASAERFLERMDEVKASADQADLFDGDYDPAKDQPGYRRDQAPTAPIGITWEQLKNKLKSATDAEPQPPAEQQAEPAAQPTPEEQQQAEALAQLQARYDALFAEIFGKSNAELTPAERESHEVQLAHREVVSRMKKEQEAIEADADKRGQRMRLIESLRRVHVYVSLATVNTFSAQQIEVALQWADAYAENPDKAPARPFWLPMPDVGATPKDETTPPVAESGTEGASVVEGKQEERGDDAEPGEQQPSGEGDQIPPANEPEGKPSKQRKK